MSSETGKCPDDSSESGVHVGGPEHLEGDVMVLDMTFPVQGFRVMAVS